VDAEELSQLDQCLQAESGLSPWEIDFIESMEKLRNRDLSTLQADKLYDIASRL